MQSVVHVVATASTSGGSTSSTAYPALASALPAARTAAATSACTPCLAGSTVRATRMGRATGSPTSGAGAPGAAAGGARAIPRVVGAAAQLVVGVPAQTERGRVGAADDDGARAPPVRHRRAVALRDEILEGRHAVRRGHAFLVDVLLDR